MASNKIQMNHGWTFENENQTISVVLPHNAVDLPYDYPDETSYQREFRYRRQLNFSADMNGKEVSLQFDGVMANSRVYLNGQLIVSHLDGYTPFEARLTDRLKNDTVNEIEVVINGAENPQIPPFGGRIDYLTYAGIYRDVWLKICDPVFIGNVKTETRDVLSDAPSVLVNVWLEDPQKKGISGTLLATLIDPKGVAIVAQRVDVSDDQVEFHFSDLTGIELWDVRSPNLYKLVLEFVSDRSSDTWQQSFGFRQAEFTTNGFFLNGIHLNLLGLNRHQSFPYVGYALGRAAQENDADILKHDLGCNIVRTAHYPQSPWFLDQCDRIGLLVFEEIPGWQHIGDQNWQDLSLANVEAMIKRDWNHPSIIIWGVRINESLDSNDFYKRTNNLARKLDSTRQTGGVRCIENSEMLEDVYTMNDFILGSEILPGSNRGRTPIRDQQEITGLDQKVPYLITEYGGHMYPTRSEDGEDRQLEHVIRHLEVINATFGDPSISGCIGWCFADYNTHKDFGAGDRICHHGVLDMFREPKFAAFAYASQMDPAEKIVLEPVTYWTQGGRSIGGVLPLMILTNCDYVEVKTGEQHAKMVYPDKERFPHLPHPPVFVTHHEFSDITSDEWGKVFHGGEITAYLDGKAVATRKYVADPLPCELEILADRLELSSDGQDCTRVVVRALDQVGNRLPFLRDFLEVRLDGSAQLVGPEIVPFRCGTACFWVRSGAMLGVTTITVTSRRLPSVSLKIKVISGSI